MANLSLAQLVQVAWNAGWRGTDLITAVAVSLAENHSSDPTAVGPTQDYGLWQINQGNFAALNLTAASAMDPQANANAAYQLWKQGGGNAASWAHNWTTYTSPVNNYESYLGAAQLAVANLGISSASTPSGTGTTSAFQDALNQLDANMRTAFAGAYPGVASLLSPGGSLANLGAGIQDTGNSPAAVAVGTGGVAGSALGDIGDAITALGADIERSLLLVIGLAIAFGGIYLLVRSE